MICEYCKSTDGEQSKYHPGTCGHCGAKMVEAPHVYGMYYGKPVTDPLEWADIQRLWIEVSMQFSRPMQIKTLQGQR